MADTKTPRTDAFLAEHGVIATDHRYQIGTFARQLELENAELTAKLARAQAALKHEIHFIGSPRWSERHSQAIREAKEAKK